MFWGKDVLEKDDLVQVLRGQVDALIDTVDGTQFSAAENKWKEIPHGSLPLPEHNKEV